LDTELRKKHLEEISELIASLGEDPKRDGLLNTPKRHLEALEFLTSGYKTNVRDILEKALFEVEYQDMVIIRDIEFYSLCEHHLLPFHGKVHVGYIPESKVVGLSKIPRAVEVFARRLQVQERLTNEIALAIQEILRPVGVGVVIEAFHMCMMMRGVQKQSSYTMTSSMQGSFQVPETRQEFLKLIHSPRCL
tara:strand:+ start:676 stop:1251 length:576 start_codon:yes stop_codon:yes gene_type:complete